MTSGQNQDTNALVLDGVTNATDSLAKAAEYARSDDPMKWKWLPLCVDHALYTAAIACLARDLRFVLKAAFGGWSRRPVPPAEMYYEQTVPIMFESKKLQGPHRLVWEKGKPEGRRKKKQQDLIGFWTALARVQDREWFMAQYCITRPLELSDEDMYWISFLHNELRNPLIHFVPVMSEIPIQEAARACRIGAWAAAFLLADSLSPQALNLEQSQREAIAASYATIQKITQECERSHREMTT